MRRWWKLFVKQLWCKHEWETQNPNYSGMYVWQQCTKCKKDRWL